MRYTTPVFLTCFLSWTPFSLVGCNLDDARPRVDALPTDAGTEEVSAYPLTDQVQLVPVATRPETPDERSPLVPKERDAMLQQGLGEVQTAAGQPHVTHVMGGGRAPEPGPNAQMITRFAHLADLQLADDESPARAVALDGPGFLGGAFRPQESNLCHMTNAMVRTLNRVHAGTPLDFVLLGGDQADNGQSNEVDWVLSILEGSPQVECDSADDTDLVDGPDNDGKDPFEAPGLAMPFYWVTGNHDVLIQGTVAITDEFQAIAIGDTPHPSLGCRDFSVKGAPLTFEGPVPADEKRFFLGRDALVERVAKHGDGHGLGSAQVRSGKATYTQDITGTNLRLLVLDTAHEAGGGGGLILQADVDADIAPALDQAVQDGKWVILASHHAVASLTTGSGLGGQAQEGALTQEQWLALLEGYPNVLFSLVGHSHVSRVEALGGDHKFWELTTTAIADYPHQARLIEIWDQDNGWLMLRATQVDFDVTDDPVAAEGRRLGVMDFIAGWSYDGRGEEGHSNVELWIPVAEK